MEFGQPYAPVWDAKRKRFDAPPASTEPFVHAGVGTLPWYEFVGLGGQDFISATFDPTKPLDDTPPYNGFTAPHESMLKVRKWDHGLGVRVQGGEHEGIMTGSWAPGANRDLDEYGVNIKKTSKHRICLFFINFLFG